jgi:HEAT repeat protein
MEPGCQSQPSRLLPCPVLLVAAWLLNLILLPSGEVRAQTPSLAEDVKVLEKAGVAIDGKSLLVYLQKGFPRPVDAKQVEKLIGQLDTGLPTARDQTVQALKALGRGVLPLLRQAMATATGDKQRRLEDCIQHFESHGNPEVEAAAARRLAELRPEGTVDTLLELLSAELDPWVEDQVLRAVSKLTLPQGRPTAALLDAAKGASAPRRAGAAYVLGSRSDAGQREPIRQLLGDPDPQVRRLAAQGLLGRGLYRQLQESRSTDEQLLRKYNVPTTEAGLLAFVQRRILNAQDQARIKTLIAKLGADKFSTRDQATRQLRDIGPPALPFLKAAVTSPDLEVVVRAKDCIVDIETGPEPSLPVAAVRFLADHSPQKGIKALLDYVPFAADEQIEEEILKSLCLLSVREAGIDPQLRAALDAKGPVRAAAAYVLARVGTAGDAAGKVRLLRDEDLQVRFLAARGLAAAGESRSVPVLIELLDQLPDSQAVRIEEILVRLAGDQAPPPLAANQGPAARKQLVQAWGKWWQSHAAAVDLAAVRSDEVHLGLLLICEYDTGFGGPQGRIWECDRSGKQRWEIKGLQGPMDAHVLPNGRVLIAENNGRRVIEMDRNGKIHWDYSPPGNPIACQRLPNGNTFIATYNQVMEVTPTKQIVYNINRGPAFFIFGARKLRNGNVVCISAQGVLAEIEPRTNKEIRNHALGAGGWCGVEGLSNGHLLVAQMSQGIVRELNAQGQSCWDCRYQGAFRATRLPNGLTLACSMTTRKIGEFNRAGTLLREIPCQGRPWSVTYR